MYNFRISNKKQAGETIVEVLISILVISVALAGAFAISNRSQKTVQANQERYQAQILANSQADILKQYITSNPPNRGVVNAGNYLNYGFCMVNSSSVTPYANSINPPVPTTANTPNNCQKLAVPYFVNIKCTSGCSSTDSYSVYNIKVYWDSLVSNSGQDNVELWYGV
jgi:Tfp pilus assembly protein PilV